MISASEPIDIVPLEGNSPNIFAVFVDVRATKLFKLIFPDKTPYV